MRNPIPRVAAIHDLAGFARTSLTAAIPILSSMAFRPRPCPQPSCPRRRVGYNDFTLLDLTDDMVRILDHWERLGLRFDGVYSGFMASTAQMVRRRGASGIASLPAAWLWSIPCSGMTAS